MNHERSTMEAATDNEQSRTGMKRHGRTRKDKLRITVAARVPRILAERLKAFTQLPGWPPPPSQSEIICRGIETVLDELEGQRGGVGAKR
jgi:hypothetical protein